MTADMMEAQPAASPARSERAAIPSLRGHLEIARLDHWVKNVFVVPGIVAAMGMDGIGLSAALAVRVAAGLLSVCLVASSNYVLNELMDAATDREHPVKRERPVPSGRVSLPLAYAQWLALTAVGVGLAAAVGWAFAATMLALWAMGLVYNVRPVRSKDLPYVDVLSEAFNNPLRLLAGWFIVGPESIAPASLLLSYWMIGCYFMAMKRFAELRQMGGAARAAAYRRSFAHYSQQRLLVSIMFYASAAMLFFGAFIMRYRLELILSFPLVALFMAAYLALAFRDNSVVAAPERLYREPLVMGTLVPCALFMAVLLWVDLPILHRMFAPTAPVSAAPARAGREEPR